MGSGRLQFTSNQRRLEVANIAVPFRLHLIHRTYDLFKSLHPASPLRQFQCVLTITRAFKDKVSERPPMEIIKIELTRISSVVRLLL